MPRWGMVIDLKKCTGCQTCTLSCKVFHGLGPGVTRCRVVEHEVGTYPGMERMLFSLRCMHCAEPECVKACPTGATKKRADGIVTVDQDECMGCRYCSLVCPYQARTFLAVEKRYFENDDNIWEKVRYREHQTGTVEKCDFCRKRIDAGMAKGLVPGKDPSASPICSIACIGKAIHFGDLNDPDSTVSRLVRERNGFALKAELGTEPSVYYLPRRKSHAQRTEKQLAVSAGMDREG
jgi:phenylacetyl-CoA:acceptor oxidoreductase subunit 1